MSCDDQISPDRREDAAAYVLGALDPEEAAGYRQHLELCGTCRREVAALVGVADALSVSVPQYEAPSGLRERVLDAARAQPHGQAQPGAVPRVQPTARWLRRKPAQALAGAMLVALAAAVIALTNLSGGPQGPRALQARVIHSLGAAQLSVSGGRAELIVRDLPPPAAGRIYEVWLKRSDRPPSPTTALFSVTATGAADVGIPGDLNGVREILVTQEPAGGSRVSTHAALIVARLS